MLRKKRINGSSHADISKIKITDTGKVNQQSQDKQIPWEQKCRDLEEELFDVYFDEASKPDEIKALKEENQRNKSTIEEYEKSTLPAHENAFIRRGDAWEIWFRGRKLNDPIVNLDGLVYIANLLSKPGKMIHVTTLCDSVNPQKKDQAMMWEDDVASALNSGQMSISTMQDDGLANEFKEKLKKNIAELKETMNDCNLPESERQEAVREHDALINTIRKEYGPRALAGKPPKKMNDGVKKELDKVQKAINRAYEKLSNQSPELCKHLKKNIETGSQCTYKNSDTLWGISF